MAKVAAQKKAPTKTQIINNIAEATGLSKKEVGSVFEALNVEIKKNISGRGPGVFTLPGLVKIEKKKVPARPARKNVPDPFRPGEFRDIAAKPATSKIKVRPLKNLKEMI